MPDDPWRKWDPYVPVGERRRIAAHHAATLNRRGRAPSPVTPRGRGRTLATTFWGRAWCENLAAYARLANRLERGRRYLRGGLVIDLQIGPGAVNALVCGSEVYEIRIEIKPVPRPRWTALVKACAGKIDSVVELLAGRFDEGVMAHVCRQGTGLFPSPAEMTYRCTCPDGAGGGWVCKHVAAALYGVGIRLDEDPEMLFRLRKVAHAELLARAAAGLTAAPGAGRSGRRELASHALSSIFGIELDASAAARPRRPARPPRTRRSASRRGRGAARPETG